jgi:hypothetical protein
MIGILIVVVNQEVDGLRRTNDLARGLILIPEILSLGGSDF